MPVTAKFSREFYERFGDRVVNELVDWFNNVDSTYRSDLKETNEANFARFDAKMEQRFAESDARVDRRFAELETRLEKRFAAVDVRLAQMETTLERGLKEQSRWMIAAWATLLIPIIGLWTR